MAEPEEEEAADEVAHAEEADARRASDEDDDERHPVHVEEDERLQVVQVRATNRGGRAQLVSTDGISQQNTNIPPVHNASRPRTLPSFLGTDVYSLFASEEVSGAVLNVPLDGAGVAARAVSSSVHRVLQPQHRHLQRHEQQLEEISCNTQATY